MDRDSAIAACHLHLNQTNFPGVVVIKFQCVDNTKLLELIDSIVPTKENLSSLNQLCLKTRVLRVATEDRQRAISH